MQMANINLVLSELTKHYFQLDMKISMLVNCSKVLAQQT